MTSTSRHLSGSDQISNALAAERLGPAAVTFFVLSAAAPLTVVAGIISTGYAVTGITGLPIAFLAVGAVLALFAVGYVTMARKVANAGAFYTYITHGLGRPAGVAAAWVALLTYNTLQVALYGGIGAAAAPLLAQWLGWQLPWWVLALLSWVLVGSLGLARVDINGKILGVLLTGEVAVIVVFDLAGLFHPGTTDLALTSLSPTSLAVPGVGALLVIAVLGFVGFEASVVFSEESRDPGRTVPRATYTAITLIAALYALSAWAMQVATGPGQVVQVARRDGAEMIFVLAAAHLSPLMIDIARVLFVTSVFAVMLAVHNTTARYLFALGREGVLPPLFGRTSRTGAPRAGSLTQSVIGLLVIVCYAIFGWDPMVGLFFSGGTLGSFGVLLLTATTSVAVVAYFRRHPGDVHPARRLWAPLAAAGLLIVTLWLAVDNFATLLGVPEGDQLAWILPSLYVVAAGVGLLWALGLRLARPDIYRQVGLGATAPLTH